MTAEKVTEIPGSVTLSLGSTQHDSRPLMRLIAKLANLDATKCRKIVLVLAPNEVPVIYAETALQQHQVAEIVEEQLEAVWKQCGGFQAMPCDRPVTVRIGCEGVNVCPDIPVDLHSQDSNGGPDKPLNRELPDG